MCEQSLSPEQPVQVFKEHCEAVAVVQSELPEQATHVPEEHLFFPVICEQSLSPEHPVQVFEEHFEAADEVH